MTTPPNQAEDRPSVRQDAPISLVRTQSWLAAQVKALEPVNAATGRGECLVLPCSDTLKNFRANTQQRLMRAGVPFIMRSERDADGKTINLLIWHKASETI